MTDVKELLNRLDALRERATAGEWTPQLAGLLLDVERGLISLRECSVCGALREENERLRATLRDVMGAYDYWCDPSHDDETDGRSMAAAFKRAREALAKGGG